jgi:ribosomal protein S18 acetylase RimI-like enzyme
MILSPKSEVNTLSRTNSEILFWSEKAYYYHRKLSEVTMEIREYTQYREDEILRLYSSVGWSAYTSDPSSLRKAFEGSLLTLAAYDNGGLAGIIRTVGDGSSIVYIQDIIVSPERQRQGIGTALVKAVLERFPSVRQIILTTDDTEQTKAFYSSCGFTELSRLGCCSFIYDRRK